MADGQEPGTPRTADRKADRSAAPRQAGPGGHGWQRVTGSLLVYRGAAQDGGQAWLLTFTDLSALMLTFFVLLFSMSSIDDRQWRNLVDAFSPRLVSLQEVTVALPQSDQTLDAVEREPGTDLDYLAAVLKEQVAANETLNRARVRHEADRIVVSVPGDLLFPPGATELGAAGQKAVFALAGVLRNLRNVVEVAGHADPIAPERRYETNWELSLARAAAVSGQLTELGYRGHIVVRGYGHTRFADTEDTADGGDRLAQARRVDIIVHSYAAEAR